MKRMLIVIASLVVVLGLSTAVFMTRPVHGQVNRASSDIQTAHKVGSNCTQNACGGQGGCAVCVHLAVSVPAGKQITAIHCLTNAGYPNDYPHYELHEVQCGQDVSWSMFDPPSNDGTTAETTYHNRSSDRDRDVQLAVDYQ